MIAKPKTLKSFFQLQPIEQQRISLVASGIMQTVFRGEKNDDFMPKKGTQVHRAWSMSKLDERQQIAWQTLCDHVNLAHGISGPISSGYGDAIDRDNSDGFRVPKAYVNSHYKRLERLWTDLTREERALLTDLIQDTLKANSSLQIEAIGLITSGYSDKVSARAAGIARIQALLGRLAAFFGI